MEWPKWQRMWKMKDLNEQEGLTLIHRPSDIDELWYQTEFPSMRRKQHECSDTQVTLHPYNLGTWSGTVPVAVHPSLKRSASRAMFRIIFQTLKI